MKKRLWKRIAASIVCCMMLLTALPVMAATDITDDIIKADEAYYKEVLGLGENGSLAPILKVKKTDETNNSRPIKNVEFKALKVGDLYRIKLPMDSTANATNRYTMVYGLDSAFAKAAQLESHAEYKFAYEGDTKYAFSKPADIAKIFQTEQSGENKTVKDGIVNYIDPANGDSPLGTIIGTTGEDGIAQLGGNPTLSCGLYVVVESDVSQAEIKEGNAPKAISITKQAYPYIVALPSYIPGENNTLESWNQEVTVITKNETGTATIEKKIVTNYDGEGDLKVDTDVELDDTDTTFMGDYVEFLLTSTIPIISHSSEQEMSKYVITDKISKGYDVKLDSIIVKTSQAIGNDQILLTKSTDYNVSELSNVADNDLQSEYSGGKQFTITFTEAGLKKLTELSKNSKEAENVYVYYKASVNKDAVIGPNNNATNVPVGNPNEVMLTYQVGTSPEIRTDWDKVTTYLFEIDVQKTLKEGGFNNKQSEVKFILYSEKGDTKIYYKFEEVAGASGTYKLNGSTDKKDEATEVSPTGNGNVLKLLGLDGYDETDNVTYYLEETHTVPGYNLLKDPIAIKLTPAKINNHPYTETETNAQYNGVLTTDGDDDGITSLKVINTKGFQLPSTGGMGIGLFVLVGAAVVAAGIIYYVSSGKKEKKCQSNEAK